jgi:hypothetical protein
MGRYLQYNRLMFYRRFALLFLCLILISACGTAPRAQQASATPSSEAAAQPTSTQARPSPIPTSTPAPTATPELASLPAPRYTLSAVYDYAGHSATVLEQILYTNRSTDALSELTLVADALIYPNSLSLSEIKTSAGPAVASSSWEKTWLHVQLDKPLQPGESIQIEASFTLSLPARTADPGLRPMVFGWSERQTNLVDWYLYLPPYQSGKGWLAHAPGYYGEHQVYEYSDFEVNLQVTNTPQGLTVAASAPEQQDGDWRRYTLKQARTFAFSLSLEYQAESVQSGDVRLTGYFFSYDEAAGKAALKTAADSLALYNRLFGAYPHAQLSLVEADFLDGMEYDGLIFLSNGFFNLYHGTQGEYLVAITAHEVAHQWWYGLVGSDQALEPWLDEALATYCERLYYENVAPDALNWWWEVRVKYYNPRGFVDDSIYNPHHETAAYRAYRDAVYLNGAMFLEDLRQQVGDEAFFAFLQDYAQTYRGTITTRADFFALLRKHTSADLSGLVKKYFGQPAP